MLSGLLHAWDFCVSRSDSIYVQPGSPVSDDVGGAYDADASDAAAAADGDGSRVGADGSDAFLWLIHSQFTSTKSSVINAVLRHIVSHTPLKQATPTAGFSS